jgi:predicted XRE-type DNA-binding protein
MPNADDDMGLVRGSGNVWRDFGYPDADLRQAKSALAVRILGALDDTGLSAGEAARRTGFAAGDFSRIRNANYGRFTLDRMIRMLHALDADVQVALDIRSVGSDRERSSAVDA